MKKRVCIFKLSTFYTCKQKFGG